jgi:hypothetical protein
MALWQMDIVGGVFLTDGTECKVVTGVDDHSRFAVIASVVPRATGRAVCLAFAEAMRRYGIPEEVLTDNGKQFTDRFGHGGEELFDRIATTPSPTASPNPPHTLAANGDTLRAALDKVLAGEPVPEPHHPSMGCGIKWKPGTQPS